MVRSWPQALDREVHDLTVFGQSSLFGRQLTLQFVQLLLHFAVGRVLRAFINSVLNGFLVFGAKGVQHGVCESLLLPKLFLAVLLQEFDRSIVLTLPQVVVDIDLRIDELENLFSTGQNGLVISNLEVLRRCLTKDSHGNMAHLWSSHQARWRSLCGDNGILDIQNHHFGNLKILPGLGIRDCRQVLEGTVTYILLQRLVQNLKDLLPLLAHGLELLMTLLLRTVNLVIRNLVGIEGLVPSVMILIDVPIRI